MAKLSSACKLYTAGIMVGFSESEIDVARQLVKLCSDIGGTGKRIKMEDEEDEVGAGSDADADVDAASPTAMVIEEIYQDISEDDHRHLKPRKRKSRSIYYLYSSTKPLVVLRDKKSVSCS